MKRSIFVVLLAVFPLAAQPQNEEPRPIVKTAPAPVKKLFILKYADPRAVENLLRVFEASISSNPEMHVIAVTAPPATMASIEEAITRLDTPVSATKNIELSIQLVVGSETDYGYGYPLPKDLESVVSQLKNAFPFKTYRLLDTLTLRARSGQSASTSSSGGAVKIGENAQPITTRFQVKSASIAQDGSTVRIDGMSTSTKLPIATGSFGSGNPLVNTQYTYSDLGMNTDLDIKEGQKVVVGRFGISHDQALFLVLTARVVS